MFYLTTHSTHFIYGYMVSDIWLRTILIVRKETCCHHTGYSYRLTARVLLYAPSHRQDITYHSLSFAKSHTCSFSLSILCTSTSYVMIFLHHFSQVSVPVICLVLYLKKIIVSKICILHCLVLLNSVLFFNLVCFDLV